MNNKSPKGQITGLLSPFLEGIRLNKILIHISGNRVLDFGCGYGKLAGILKVKEYVGIDVDEMVLAAARENYAGNNNVKFYHISRFNENMSKFDTVVMAAVIEHLDDAASTLRKLMDYLGENGKIVITTPTPRANRVLKMGAKFKLFSRAGVEQHKSLFTEKDFIEISQLTGLQLVMYERFEFGLNQLVIYKKRN